ncbi:hypothetical protein NIES4071_09820 [Calothrix sp. NIES-4071]|nr:hypothetical protein NIES4071_09820 [Calothrix sp. NIES-4071]BAZ55324.1 hypothetical protein NIES4105_09780 [Calothrix sp. NIES-4105]
MKDFDFRIISKGTRLYMFNNGVLDYYGHN